jgi:hypothetical protein
MNRQLLVEDIRATVKAAHGCTGHDDFAANRLYRDARTAAVPDLPARGRDSTALPEP